MKNLKLLTFHKAFFWMIFFSLPVYPAAYDLNLKIPESLESVFPVLTKAALYIAERTNINLEDSMGISISCGSPDLAPRDAFIQSALNALKNKTTREIYPTIKVLLFELGHTLAAEQDETAEDQIKRCIEHISYMQFITDILSDSLRKNAIHCYDRLHLIYHRQDPTKNSYFISSSVNRAANYGLLVRITVNAFSTKRQVKEALNLAKEQLEDYLKDPAAFTKKMSGIKSKETSTEDFFF